LLVGSGGHEPCKSLEIEVVVLVFGFWWTLHVDDERMRIFVVVVIVAVAESIEERVEPALLGDGFLRSVNATIW
jgi:hypothetical protein